MRKHILTTLFLVFLAVNLTRAQQPWPFLKDDAQSHTILLLGDNNFQYREKPELAFQNIQPTLDKADFVFLNLEGAFAGGTDDSNQSDMPHKNWRHSNPEQVTALTAARIDAVGIANNVTYPWQAMLKSIEVLDRANVKYTGGGNNIEEAHKPVIIEKNGLKVGFIQYAATVFPTNHAATENQAGIAEIKVHTAYQPPKNLDKPGQPPYVITWMDEKSKEIMVNDIKKLKKEADIVIASFHWGVSGTTQIVKYQEDIAYTVIDSGADVVFGHGPHKYQKIEVYKGSPIFYSLGQGVFDDRRNDRYLNNKEGLIVRLEIVAKRLKSASVVPTWREDGLELKLYDPNEGRGKELLGYLHSVNEEGAELEVIGKEIKVKGLK